MIYLYSSLISLLLYFLELSLLPHFTPWLVVPSLLLPFIVILSVKDRTLFPIILGVAAGMLLDAGTLSKIPVFTITFLLVTALSKIFFLRFVSYGELRASLLLTTLGLVLIYAIQIFPQVTTTQWSIGWFVPLTLNLALTYGALALIIIGFRGYFDWVEKTTEERYR